MASVKQVLAAIAHDGTMGPNQKQFVAKAIERAEDWCKMQSAAGKPRRVTNSKGFMTLQEWEEKRDQELHYVDLERWANKNRLCEGMLRRMIEEFRIEMMAKGKQYANFKLAFMTYLGKGYLSKKITECTLERSPYQKRDQTMVYDRGGSL